MKNIKTDFNIKIALQSLLLISAVGLFASCKKESKQTLPERSYKLVWSDEFDGLEGTAPDDTNWTYDIGAGGWGNQELQYYSSSTDNVSHDGFGNLKITATNKGTGGAPFTSARIKTQGLFAKAYGRIEARLKTPSGPGIWPAFWMLGEDITTNPWPACGEIDIMELRGQEPYIINGTLHGPGYSGGNSVTKAYTLTDGRFDTDYHIYAVEWGVDYIDFFVDDYLYNRLTPADLAGDWVYNKPFFLIFNIAVGGTYVGFPTSGTSFPQSMVIDYVRVYDEQ